MNDYIQVHRYLKSFDIRPSVQRTAVMGYLISRALKSPFSYYIIVDLVKHSFYQVNNLYFKFEPKR